MLVANQDTAEVFVFDKSIAHQARVEELLQEIHANQSRATPDDSSSDDPDD